MAACFKHDNNVCACAVSALSQICHRKWIPRLTAHAQFRPHFYFRFKILLHILIQHISFPIKTQSFPAHDTLFGDFCDTVSAHAQLSASILLSVAE